MGVALAAVCVPVALPLPQHLHSNTATRGPPVACTSPKHHIRAQLDINCPGQHTATTCYWAWNLHSKPQRSQTSPQLAVMPEGHGHLLLRSCKPYCGVQNLAWPAQLRYAARHSQNCWNHCRPHSSKGCKGS
ncbi:hypothetical protein COO60DRAFT_619816 [Scenedesmus sp. NREL 46B-D3]|nr:hypothetical protein COO60DRAFT_619816 [Scenedesmus sp. NREL 46B-D3]